VQAGRLPFGSNLILFLFDLTPCIFLCFLVFRSAMKGNRAPSLDEMLDWAEADDILQHDQGLPESPTTEESPAVDIDHKIMQHTAVREAYAKVLPPFQPEAFSPQLLQLDRSSKAANTGAHPVFLYVEIAGTHVAH
jgi:hypothetical protein